jgi:uridine kinase
MWVAEALQNQKLANIAGSIAERSPSPRLVLIAGLLQAVRPPSPSDWRFQLLSLGLQPMTLSLDNYFVSREKTPLDEDGNYDSNPSKPSTWPCSTSIFWRLLPAKK